MTIKYTILPNNLYLHFLMTGSANTLEDMVNLTQSAIEIAHDRGHTCLLLDDRELIVNVTSFDMVTIAEMLSAQEIQTAGFRVAVVCPPDRLKHSLFLETAYRNRSLALSVFTDVNSAEDWLTQKKSTRPTLKDEEFSLKTKSPTP